MRALAKKILAARGSLIETDGVFEWHYRHDEIRIALQPAIAGASMPSWLNIWRRDVKVLQMIWFAWRGDGHTEVLINRPEGELEAALKRRRSDEDE